MEPSAEKTLHESRQRGRDLEFIFQKMALMQGLFARKIPLSCRAIGDGRYLPIESELDWQLINRKSGRVAFIDTKSFQGDRYLRSFFKEHQVKLAFDYNECGIISGFCIWFRKPDKVAFFTGQQVFSLSVGSLTPEDGLILGTGFDFELQKLFQ